MFVNHTHIDQRSNKVADKMSIEEFKARIIAAIDKSVQENYSLKHAVRDKKSGAYHFYKGRIDEGILLRKSINHMQFIKLPGDKDA
jgi:hypothetical protein